MKIFIELSEDEKADRGLQIALICEYLKKDTQDDWVELNDNEVIRLQDSEPYYTAILPHTVSDPTPVEDNTYKFELIPQ